MKLMAIPDKVRENKKNYLSRNFISQQVKLCKNHSNEPKLLPLPIPKNREEIVFRKNGKSVDKVHEFDFATGAKIKTTHYDYFNDNKIRSIDEFDIESGKVLRTTNFILYKSVDEFDVDSGKKLRTINYNLKDENKISSIQEYSLEHEKIVKVYIYRKDANSVSIIKDINPETGKVVKWTSYKEDGKKINSISEYDYVDGKPLKTSYFYEDGVTIRDVHEYNKNGKWEKTSRFSKNQEFPDKQIYSKVNYKNVKELDEKTKARMAKLIDNLFNKNKMKLKFECI